jgi:hypothetical protein
MSHRYVLGKAGSGVSLSMYGAVGDSSYAGDE